MNSEPRNLKRRFIAGAVCPRCEEMDTIMMSRTEGVDYRECVSCDFSETAVFDGPREELPTRVNRPAEPASPAGAGDIQVVKVIEPGKKD